VSEHQLPAQGGTPEGDPPEPLAEEEQPGTTATQGEPDADATADRTPSLDPTSSPDRTASAQPPDLTPPTELTPSADPAEQADAAPLAGEGPVEDWQGVVEGPSEPDPEPVPPRDGGSADDFLGPEVTTDLEPDGAAADADDGTSLRESHAWQVSADAVRHLPADQLLAPAESVSLAVPSGPLPDAEDATEPTRPTPPSAAPIRPTGWAALGSALRPRATRAQVLAGVLCAVLGFAIVVQLRQNGDSTLSQLRQDDLVRLLDEASTRSDQLSREAADLQRERDQLVSGSNTRQAAIDAARRSAATQGILAGRLPAVGPGVRITVTDSGSSVRPITMLNMLEELRNAGAEAVQLNDQRVTASSAFTGSTGAVQLDGTTLTAPYVWLVIGDPDTIATALDIPGGAMAYVRNDGGSGSVDKLTEVHVDALRPVTEPRYATPAAVPGS